MWISKEADKAIIGLAGLFTLAALFFFVVLWPWDTPTPNFLN